MCLDTHGLCTWTTSFRGLINLKPSIEITGNVVVSNPSLFWTTFLLRPAIAIYFIVVLYFAIADGHADLSDVQSFTKLMSIFTFISYLIYITLSMIALAVNPNNITYQCALFIIQFTAATAFQCFRQDLFSGDLTPYGLSTILVVIECFLSLYQFNYLYGALSVILFNAICSVVLCTAIDTTADTDVVLVVAWNFNCLIWHLILVYCKNYVNVAWFTSQRISPNVDKFSLLNTKTNVTQDYLAELAQLNGNESYCNIVLASCVDQRLDTMPAFQAMSREPKDVVLLMGDNIYADLAPPTMTKLKAKISKEQKVFKDEYETLLTHKDFPLKDSDAVVLALWDDHDYGDNNAAQEYARKNESKKAFIDFVESVNSTEQVQSQLAVMKEEEDRGVYFYYDHEQKVGDAENAEVVKLRMIMLDGRFHRVADDSVSDMLGDTQWNWLKDRMNERDDVDWYLVCNGSPLLNEGTDGKKMVGQVNRDKLFAILRENDEALMDKTILLSGDLHYSVWHSAVDGRVHELTSSSVTHSQWWWRPKWQLKYMEIDGYKCAEENDGNGATGKSPNWCRRNNFGVLKVNKKEWGYCVKDSFGYSYLHVKHSKNQSGSVVESQGAGGNGPSGDS